MMGMVMTMHGVMWVMVVVMVLMVMEPALRTGGLLVRGGRLGGIGQGGRGGDKEERAVAHV